MNKKTWLILLLCSAICYAVAVTSSPYTGAGWNTAAPNDEALAGEAYRELQDLRKGVEIRVNKEHIDLASSSVGGEHMQGSARMFYLATASIPALQPDGTALVAADNGMLWHDITTDYIYALDDFSDPTVGNGWVSIGKLLGDVDVGASKFTVAAATGDTVCAGTMGVTGAITATALITANAGVTLGAGDDLIGSSTSDITMNTNKFTVAGATGNTVIAGTLTQQGVATLADTSAMATSGAPAADAQIANKKYVDDQVAANVESSTLSAIGQAELPGGLQLKWGNVSVAGNGSSSVDFTDASLTDFSNACLQAFCSFQENAGAGSFNEACSVTAKSTTGITILNDEGTTNNVAWFALGH